ncbi:unnamed protein product [Ectocarpus sp. CCAP 1310/34]|nr:unnamed protein product [Ectocarpus sp. CCAP 1310/34]
MKRGWTLRNALDGGNYFRNLFSVLFGRDVGSEEFDMWLAGVSEPPALTLRDLEKWLIKTKANVVVWSHRGSGDHVLGPIDKKTDLRPRGLHVGVREGHVYRLELDGPWCNRFGSSLDVASNIVSEPSVDSVGLPRRSKQPARKKRKRGRTSEFNMWLSSYSHWDSLSVSAHGITIRTWCSASMGGLDPDGFEPDQATRLIELHNELGLKFFHAVFDFRVSSQYSQSLLALLEVCWRGPIVGAEEVSGTSYGTEGWQCDINGAHTAALMSMEVVPVFGHVDEVEEYDDHDIENWTLHKIELDALGKPDDVFLNADVSPVFGRNYKRYLDLVDTAARHRVTHFVRPSRVVSMCHIPTLAKDLLAHELGYPLLQDADYRIDAVMVTGCDEAFAVGGKIVPVLGEVDRVKAELRTGQEKLGIESLRTGDTYLCLDAERTWYRDGFWALGALILDETRLRVLEARNALESCGASDFSYQCDARFLSMILAAAHSSGTHVIGTYDTHQLQPVCDSSGMSISKDNVDMRVILENAFPICFLVFAQKRDKTVEEQVEMDDGLLYILAAGDDSHEAQTRAIERFGRAQHRDLGDLGKFHRNHTYNSIRSSADEVVVASVFDGAVSLEETPGILTPTCTDWLYTAVSRATGPSNVRVIDDIHRSESNMFDREKGGRHREALVQQLLHSYGGRCNLCTCELVWAIYSERQPTLDRLDCSLPHTAENVDVKCLTKVQSHSWSRQDRNPAIARPSQEEVIHGQEVEDAEGIPETATDGLGSRCVIREIRPSPKVVGPARDTLAEGVFHWTHSPILATSLGMCACYRPTSPG